MPKYEASLSKTYRASWRSIDLVLARGTFSTSVYMKAITLRISIIGEAQADADGLSPGLERLSKLKQL
jgi:hypothetical protein